MAWQVCFSVFTLNETSLIIALVPWHQVSSSFRLDEWKRKRGSARDQRIVRNPTNDPAFPHLLQPSSIAPNKGALSYSRCLGRSNFPSPFLLPLSIFIPSAFLSLYHAFIYPKMPFKSSQPDIDRKFLYPSQPPQPTSAVPTNITTWTWLFSSPASPLSKNPDSEIAGFRNALTEQRISYSEVKRHTTHLSTALVKHHGLVKGDVVALFSPNTPWYPVAMLAVNRVAGIVSGASPAYNVEEMTYALKTAGAKYLFTVPGSMQVAAAAAKEAGIGREKVFLLEGKMEGFMGMGELLEQGRKEREQVVEYKLKDGERNADLCGFLSFSSGTTGLPKAVSPLLFILVPDARIIQEGKGKGKE